MVRLQNEIVPKMLMRYEKGFEKREKKIRKTIRNVHGPLNEAHRAQKLPISINEALPLLNGPFPDLNGPFSLLKIFWKAAH